MKDLMGVMKQAKAMQEQMQNLQQELAGIVSVGQSGAGLVSVTLNGKSEMTALAVDPSLCKPDEKEILEDLVLAAHNDAKAKLEHLIEEKTQAMTAGLRLPGGLKFPF